MTSDMSIVGLLFEATMAGVIVREERQNTRITIRGPLEARTAVADRMIFAGLNQGTWPAAVSADLFIPAPVREQLGLPPVHYTTGLNAHDFLRLAALPGELFLTRTRRMAETETLPSRFLVQMAARTDLSSARAKGDIWLHWAHELRQTGESGPHLPLRAARVHATEAGPVPTVWSASGLTDFIGCPYKFMAKRVWKLTPVAPFEQPPEALERGNLLHECLEIFARTWQKPFTSAVREEALKQLEKIGRRLFAERIRHKAAHALWWARYRRQIKAWILKMEELETRGQRPVLVEAQGKTTVGAFTFTARADRIDTTPEGCVLVDYKTGSIPSRNDVVKGTAPQLALEAFIAHRGGFPGLSAGTAVAGLTYWGIKGGGTQAMVEQPVSTDVAESEPFLHAAEEGAHTLARQAADPAFAYPARPGGRNSLEVSGPCTTCDFAGICRFKDWIDHV